MFFGQLDEIERLARQNSCAVFVVPDEMEVELPKALRLAPEGKSLIAIEQVREVIMRLNVKQCEDRFVLIRPAEALGEEAANAMLKSLEEPGDKVHFVLVTSAPARLLPTILSRAAVYFLKTVPEIDADIVADESTKVLAKRLLSARAVDLPALVEDICKKKDGVRQRALLVLSVAIQMAYKAYFMTGKVAFIVKLPGLLAAYEAIDRNGHVKLQIVANLL